MNMIKIVESNDRTREYDEYLRNHISNVKRSWAKVLRPALLTTDDFSAEDIVAISLIIDEHDASKYSSVEYYPYLEYFYPSDGSDRDYDNVPDDVQKEFDKAWLHHQQCNPHHWQNWILVRDSGELEPMDMSIEYICEMLCDWHSFSAKYPESTAYKWYQDNKDKMVFSENTRKVVEKYVEFMKTSLSEI